MSAQPVVLFSDVTPPLTPSAGVTVQYAVRLRNTDSVGVLINKLVFSGTRTPETFGVRLSYQGIPITNGWILVHSFCWPQTEFGENRRNFVVSLPIGGPAVRLAKPLYLGPGEWIDVSFQTQQLPVAASFSAAAHGYQAASKPTDLWLPYFTEFRGRARNVDTDGGTFVESSTPQDLGNPFDNDLYIERLIGRAPLGDGVTSAISGNVVGTIGNFFLIGLSDSKDNRWISDRTPLQNAFNPSDRSWRMNTVLAAKQYLRVQVEGAYIGQPAPGTKLFTPLIGLVGYRRIYG